MHARVHSSRLPGCGYFTMLCLPGLATTGDKLRFAGNDWGKAGAKAGAGARQDPGSGAFISSEAAGRFEAQGFRLVGRVPMHSRPTQGSAAPPRQRVLLGGQDAGQGNGATRGPGTGAASSGGDKPVEVEVYRATPPGDFYVARWAGKGWQQSPISSCVKGLRL